MSWCNFCILGCSFVLRIGVAYKYKDYCYQLPLVKFVSNCDSIQVVNNSILIHSDNGDCRRSNILRIPTEAGFVWSCIWEGGLWRGICGFHWWHSISPGTSFFLLSALMLTGFVKSFANKEMTRYIRKYCSVLKVLIKYSDVFLDYFSFSFLFSHIRKSILRQWSAHFSQEKPVFVGGPDIGMRG